MKDFLAKSAGKLKLAGLVITLTIAAMPPSGFCQIKNVELPAQDANVNPGTDNISGISHPILTPRPDIPILNRQAVPRISESRSLPPQAWRVTANRMQQADLPGGTKLPPQTVSRSLPYRFNETLLSVHAALLQQGFSIEQAFSHAGQFLILSPEKYRLVIALSHINENTTIVHICPEQENAFNSNLSNLCEDLLNLAETILSRRKSI